MAASTLSRMMMHMHQETSDPTTLACACTTLRKAGRAVGRLYDSTLARTGMNANQLAILRALGRNGPLPLSRLAAAMVMDRTSLYRALEPLQRSGWVAIEPASTGHVRVASLTPADARAKDGAASAWEDAQTRFVGAFGADGWRDLSDRLLGLIEVARNLEPTHDGANG